MGWTPCIRTGGTPMLPHSINNDDDDDDDNYNNNNDNNNNKNNFNAPAGRRCSPC